MNANRLMNKHLQKQFIYQKRVYPQTHDFLGSA